MLNPEQNNEQISDIDMAWEGAYAEDSVRKLAGDPELAKTQAEKDALLAVAGRKGEKAMREYVESKNNLEIERMKTLFGNIESKLREQGLENDAEIIRNAQQGIDVVFNGIKQSKLVSPELLIAVQHDQKGGKLLLKDSRGAVVASDVAEHMEGEEAAKYIAFNRYLSKKGEQVALESLGVISPNETIRDIPKLPRYKDKMRMEREDGYQMYVPTNMEGWNLRIVHYEGVPNSRKPKNLELYLDPTDVMKKKIIDQEESY